MLSETHEWVAWRAFPLCVITDDSILFAVYLAFLLLSYLSKFFHGFGHPIPHDGDVCCSY
jgi:hypothetical protein